MYRDVLAHNAIIDQWHDRKQSKPLEKYYFYMQATKCMYKFMVSRWKRIIDWLRDLRELINQKYMCHANSHVSELAITVHQYRLHRRVHDLGM